MTLSRHASLNLQRRLYDLWPSLLMDAIEISEQAGPSGRLVEVLTLIQAAEAAVRTAVSAQACISPASTHSGSRPSAASRARRPNP